MSMSKKTENTLGIEHMTTDDLKARFKAQTVPLEADFHDLIEVAECGRRALGQNPAQTPNPRSGMVLEDGQLLVKPNVAKGIEVTPNGVGVVANAAKGIEVTANGVGIHHDATLQVTSNKLGIPDHYIKKSGESAISNGNLTFSTPKTGIYFSTGGCIKSWDDGHVYWYTGQNGAMPIIYNQVTKVESHIATEAYVNSKTTQAEITAKVKLNTAKGIEVSTAGVGVNHDATLRVTNNQLGVADNYVKKNGSSTIKDGLLTLTNASLIIATDSSGVEFPGGGKIVGYGNGNLDVRKGKNNIFRVLDNSGKVEGEVATKPYVDNAISTYGETEPQSGAYILFELQNMAVGLPGVVDFAVTRIYHATLSLISGHAITSHNNKNGHYTGDIIRMGASGYGMYIDNVVLLRNHSNGFFAVGIITSNQPTKNAWCARGMGCKIIPINQPSFDGYMEIKRT